jgi:hypothetical protein
MLKKSKPDSESETARLKYQLQWERRLRAHDKLIGEADFWKGLLKWCGVGSLVGLVGIVGLVWSIALPWARSYIDQQVTFQIKKWNMLEEGIVSAHEARWHEALAKLWEAYQCYKDEPQRSANKEYRLFPEYRSLLFGELLYVLASDGNPHSGNQWEGQAGWDNLNNDDYFRRELTTRHDEAFCTQMFLCTLKFDRKSDSLDQIVSYLKDASKQTASDESRAEHGLKLAMADLVQGYVERALSQLTSAFSYDQTFPNNLVKRLKSYKGETEYQMWRSYARLTKKDFTAATEEFDPTFEHLMHEIELKEKPDKVASVH